MYKRRGKLVQHPWCRKCIRADDRARPRRVGKRERVLIERKRYALRHPERVRAQARKKYEKRRDYYVGKAKEYYRVDPERFFSWAHGRRVKERSRGNYTTAQWNDLIQMTGRRCLCCGESEVKLTRDHVVPIARGGDNTIANIQPLCFRCNRRKGLQIIDYREKKCG